MAKVSLRWLVLWKKKAHLKRTAIMSRFFTLMHDYSERFRVSLIEEALASLQKQSKARLESELK